jgi:hypothetical protein
VHEVRVKGEGEARGAVTLNVDTVETVYSDDEDKQSIDM